MPVNSSASRSVKLFILEVRIKVINADAVVVLCFVIKLNAFKSSKEHVVVVIKIVVLDISLKALVRLIAFPT